MEEFILRIGANASALKSELGRAGAWAKAWATTLVEDLHGKIGRMFAAGFVLDKAVEKLKEVRERVLAIQRAQGELPGVSANFIQGVLNYMDRVGLSFEAASKPLLKFKQTLDAAKMNPAGDEMRSLERYNIVTGEADLKTQKYAVSVSKLSEAYLKSGKNLQVLRDLVGKESLSPGLLALLEIGPEKLARMGRGNLFTNFTGGNLEFFSNSFKGATGAGQVLNATLGNLFGTLARYGLGATFVMRALSESAHPIDFYRHPIEGFKRIFVGDKDAEEESKIAEKIEDEQKRVDIQNKFVELKEKERELTAEINDQGKVSLDQMANEAQRRSGLQMPKLYGMTPRMLTAFNIKALEARSNIAFEQGNDVLSGQLMKQAQEMRASNPWLKDKDQNPMKKTETELEVVNRQLEPVKKMAEMVNKDAQSHGHATGKSAGIEG